MKQQSLGEKTRLEGGISFRKDDFETISSKRTSQLPKNRTWMEPEKSYKTQKSDISPSFDFSRRKSVMPFGWGETHSQVF